MDALVTRRRYHILRDRGASSFLSPSAMEPISDIAVFEDVLFVSDSIQPKGLVSAISLI